MILLQQDSALSKDDKNMAVLVPLTTQPQNLSLPSIAVSNYGFIRAATQNTSFSPSHVNYVLFPQEICH